MKVVGINEKYNHQSSLIRLRSRTLRSGEQRVRGTWSRGRRVGAWNPERNYLPRRVGRALRELHSQSNRASSARVVDLAAAADLVVRTRTGLGRVNLRLGLRLALLVLVHVCGRVQRREQVAHEPRKRGGLVHVEQLACRGGGGGGEGDVRPVGVGDSVSAVSCIVNVDVAVVAFGGR